MKSGCRARAFLTQRGSTPCPCAGTRARCQSPRRGACLSFERTTNTLPEIVSLAEAASIVEPENGCATPGQCGGRRKEPSGGPQKKAFRGWTRTRGGGGKAWLVMRVGKMGDRRHGSSLTPTHDSHARRPAGLPRVWTHGARYGKRSSSNKREGGIMDLRGDGGGFPQQGNINQRDAPPSCVSHSDQSNLPSLGSRIRLHTVAQT